MSEWIWFLGVALWAILPGYIAKKKGRKFWGYYLFSFILTPLVTTIITLCLNKIPEKRKGEPNLTAIMPQVSIPAGASKAAAPEPNAFPKNDPVAPISPAAEAMSTPGEGEAVMVDSSLSPGPEKRETPKYSVRFCRHCGNSLVPGSTFCSSCGGRVWPENMGQAGTGTGQ